MLKGYIEGYYGRLFSEDERAKVINHMGKLKMDFYLYAVSYTHLTLPTMIRV